MPSPDASTSPPAWDPTASSSKAPNSSSPRGTSSTISPLIFRTSPELPAAITPAELNPNQQKVFEALGSEEASLDSVIVTSGLTAAVVSSTLLALEMRRLVKQLPGKRFVKLV